MHLLAQRHVRSLHSYCLHRRYAGEDIFYADVANYAGALAVDGTDDDGGDGLPMPVQLARRVDLGSSSFDEFHRTIPAHRAYPSLLLVRLLQLLPAIPMSLLHLLLSPLTHSMYVNSPFRYHCSLFEFLGVLLYSVVVSNYLSMFVVNLYYCTAQYTKQLGTFQVHTIKFNANEYHKSLKKKIPSLININTYGIIILDVVVNGIL